ncbi:MAG: OsmC family protein [Bacteroidales bacterium]|nr:OsmC family protein [Bacteroidales bacterium]
MQQKLDINFLGGMAFETEMNGHKVYIDADESVGGKNSAPRPKAMMMLALAGCTGMDVVSILRKMRVEYDDLTVSIDAELDDEFPKPYTSMKVIYRFWGKDLPKDKIQKAVDLSKDRYCGVSANYKDSFPLSHEIILEEN